ncbi:MAG: hypothetical protein ABIH70_07175 [Chloroflexota bacterium]
MYEVVWPRGRRAEKTARLARRPGTLEGKTIGTVWNGGFRGNDIFPVIAKELAKKYPKTKFINHEAFGPIYGGGEAEGLAALPKQLKQNKCDAVITGMGC